MMLKIFEKIRIRKSHKKGSSNLVDSVFVRFGLKDIIVFVK